jgi:hypothetical protein
MSLSLEIFDFSLAYIQDTAADRSGTQEDYMARAMAAGYTMEDLVRVGTIVLVEMVNRLVIKEPSFDLLLGAVYDASPEQREKIAREVRAVLASGVFYEEVKQNELFRVRSEITNLRARIIAAAAARDAISKEYPAEVAATLDAGMRALGASEAALLRTEQDILQAILVARG